jgi:hypothetical protein
MENLARREGAEVAVTAQVRENSPGAYSLTVALLELARRRPMQDEAFCDSCDQEALRTKLGDLADKVWRTYRSQSQPPTAAVVPTELSVPVVPVVPSVPVVPVVPSVPVIPNGEPERRSRFGNESLVLTQSAPRSDVPARWPATLSPRRKLLAGVLGGVAGAALITSIALTATNHREFTCNNSPCVLWAVPYYTTGYALVGGLAITTGFLLFLPETAPASDKRPLP